MLNIDELLEELEGDTACGENLEYDPLILETREAIEGKAEQQIGDDVIEGVEPDWKTVKKNSLALCKKTHSLEVVISLIQALMNLEGYSGLADGSKLLEGSIEKYWACIHPQLDPDDNDPMERLNMLAIFEDFNFLLSLQKIQLLSSKGVGSVSLYDIRNAKNKTTDENGDNIIDEKLIDAIFLSCSDEDKEQVFSYLDQSASSFQNISSFLQEEETVGASNAPTFTEFLKLLNEAKSAVGTHLSQETGDINNENDVESINSTSANPAVVNTSGISSRQDVISSIEKIEEYYIKNEPGSPILLLLPDSLHQLAMIFGSTQSNDNNE